MSKPAVLWVDNRVGSVELLPLLLAQRVPAVETTLDAGDFLFEGRGVDGSVAIAIERKTIGDLVGSLQSGRFQGRATENGTPQLVRMQESYDFNWLLIEGLWDTDSAGRLCQRRRGGKLTPLGGFTEDSLTKRLLSIELHGNIRIKQTVGKRQSAAWIASLFRWWTDKAWDDHRTLQVTHKAYGLRPISRFRERCMCLPGVGLAVSKALETAFAGNELRLLNARLSAIAGISVATPAGPRRLGPAKARAIIDALCQLRGER